MHIFWTDVHWNNCTCGSGWSYTSDTLQHPRPAMTTNIRHAANNVQKYMIGSRLSNGRLSFQPILCRSCDCLWRKVIDEGQIMVMCWTLHLQKAGAAGAPRQVRKLYKFTIYLFYFTYKWEGVAHWVYWDEDIDNTPRIHFCLLFKLPGKLWVW